MAFGYIGYLWTLCGCAMLLLAALGGAAALYALAGRGRGAQPTTRVEDVTVGHRPPGGGGGDAA